MNRTHIITIVTERVLQIITRPLIVMLAFIIFITSQIINYIKNLDKKGQIRLGLTILACSAALIIFLTLRHDGCVIAFFKSIGLATVSIIVLTFWLEFFGINVFPDNNKTEFFLLITSKIRSYIRNLDRKKRVRLGLTTIACFIALIIFFVLKHDGCVIAFFKSIGFATISIVVLTVWLEFFGINVVLDNNNAEWEE